MVEGFMQYKSLTAVLNVYYGSVRLEEAKYIDRNEKLRSKCLDEMKL